MPFVAESLNIKTYTYLDVNTNYGVIGPLLLVDIDTINNQIFNLFQTMIGEADYEPEFGSSMPNRLFDLLPGTKDLLENDLYMALSRWMGSKIQVDPSDVVAVENYEQRAYDVYVKYVIPSRAVRVEYGVRLYTTNNQEA